jgi:hypothetical protein
VRTIIPFKPSSSPVGLPPGQTSAGDAESHEAVGASAYPVGPGPANLCE